jgi:GntP family gluconate:H+ symporter
MATVALVPAVLAQSQAPPAPAAGGGQLILAALLGIAVVVLLISWLQVHPFLALIAGSAVVGLVGGLGAAKTIKSFTTGTGTTLGGVGVLVALGAMIGGLLTDSGGANRVVEAVTSRVGPRTLPWAMAAVAALMASRCSSRSGSCCSSRSCCWSRPARSCRCSRSGSRRWPASPCCTGSSRRTPAR